MHCTGLTLGSLLLTMALAFGLSACQGDDGEGGTDGSANAAVLPASYFLDTAPESALGVADAKAKAKVGETIILQGRIGGSRTPFVDSRAAFTIVGPGPLACSDNPDDACRTPWDYCCEPRESLAKHSATIRVVDASGDALKVQVKGANGLRELSEIVVVGTIAQAEGDLLVVDATGIYILP